jgi:hypothetical protein
MDLSRGLGDVYKRQQLMCWKRQHVKVAFIYMCTRLMKRIA